VLEGRSRDNYSIQISSINKQQEKTPRKQMRVVQHISPAEKKTIFAHN